MFSGIIEASEPIIKSVSQNQTYQIWVQRPSTFDDLKMGDSIAVNGVCLTIEDFNSETMKFTLGFETLKVLGNTFQNQWLSANKVNLERTLRFGDRVHGHMVSGHVDDVVSIKRSEPLGDSWILAIQLPTEFRKYCWKKGSVALNGVSLTINSIDQGELEVCLVPETQKRTNLTSYKVGEKLTFESDSFAKAVVHAIEAQSTKQ